MNSVFFFITMAVTLDILILIYLNDFLGLYKLEQHLQLGSWLYEVYIRQIQQTNQLSAAGLKMKEFGKPLMGYIQFGGSLYQCKIVQLIDPLFPRLNFMYRLIQ